MSEKPTDELLKILKTAHSISGLEQYNKLYTAADNTLDFSVLFCQLLDEKGLSKANVIKKSSLERTYAYQILNGTRLPGRNKILALSISAGFSFEEIQRLLEYAKEGILYSRSSRDSTIIYGIQHGFELLRINELLDSQGEDIIE